MTIIVLEQGRVRLLIHLQPGFAETWALSFACHRHYVDCTQGRADRFVKPRHADFRTSNQWKEAFPNGNYQWCGKHMRRFCSKGHYQSLLKPKRSPKDSDHRIDSAGNAKNVTPA